MLETLNTPQWEKVFEYADPEKHDCSEIGHDHGPRSVFGSDAKATAFTREDVTGICAIHVEPEDNNMWSHWLGFFHLRDGRYAMIRAGCDYSGWD